MSVAPTPPAVPPVEPVATPAAPGAVVPPAVPVVATKPADLEDKFWNAETGEVRVDALNKSYREAQAKLSQPKTPAPDPNAPPADPASLLDPTPVKEIADNATIPEIIAATGMDGVELEKQFRENGKFTDDQYAKFKAAGVIPAIANQMAATEIRTLDANRQAAMTAAVTAAGSQQQLDNLMAWARTDATTEADKTAAKTLLGNAATVGQGVTYLKQLHAVALGAGKAKPLHDGEAAPTGGGDVVPFANHKERLVAINDLRYKSDPEYIAQVNRRSAAMKS